MLGIPGWLSNLAPAFDPGYDPGVLGSSPMLGFCMEPASPSASVCVCMCVCVMNKLKKIFLSERALKSTAYIGIAAIPLHVI